VIGTVTDCDAQHDPLPFIWTTSIKLKKSCKWAGLDDLAYIYSNPDDTIEASCITAVTLPGTYSKNDNISIQQSFDPPLVKGANLMVIVFYTHHDSFDDVLMYNFPIPGYVNIVTDEPTLLTHAEKQAVIEKIRNGSLQVKKLRSE
jgi:hypothetical protein